LSFSAALGTATPVTIAVTATTLETPEALIAKYAAAHAHVAAVEAGGGRVLYGVDATALEHEATTAGRLAAQRYRAIVFNFPFADTDGGAGAAAGFDSDWVARGRHRALLARFLRSARALLLRPSTTDTNNGNDNGGAVYVTVLLSQALAWNVEDVAHEAGYALAAILPFEGAAWAARGYRRKRTYSDATFPTEEAEDDGADGMEEGDTVAGWRRAVARQRRQWGRGPVGAWTLVFRPTQP
jgi:hypothetical protein